MSLPFAVSDTDEDIHRSTWTGKGRPHAYDPNKPFVGWDGEGYTDNEGVHHYNLFGCSDGSFIMGDSLQHEECFELLLTVAAKRPAIHVIYSGTYDLVMMIHKLDEATCRRIMSGKPTWIGQVRVTYYRSKWLALKHKDGRRIILYDVYTFFASSFVSACRTFLGDDATLQEIATVKTQRSTFSQEDLENKVIPYWQKELEYLVKLCETLRERLAKAGIIMHQWHGPGAIATQVLRKNSIKPHLGEIPDEIKELARHAYYGGRFEQFRLGMHDGPVWQYDINSAYPTAIAKLPSYTDTEWISSNNWDGVFDDDALYQIRFRSPIKWFGLYPLPWRSEHGRIYYPPRIGAPSWYWGIECRNLRRHNAQFDVIEAKVPVFHTGFRPFAFVEDMYNERLKMKKAGDPTQLAVKLALNSLYGKLAQAKGAKKNKDGTWKIPSFHQLLWAGWITAHARAQIYDALMIDPDSMISVETDAVFSTKELSLPVSEKLGNWSVTKYDRMIFIQSGVYFGEQEGIWKLKSRGFEQGTQAVEPWMKALSHSPMRRDSISYKVNRFGSIPGMTNWGKWYEFERETVFIPSTTKRVHVISICPECRQHKTLLNGLHHLMVPQHYIPSKDICSTPHSLPWSESNNYRWESIWDEYDVETFEMEGMD